MPYPAGLIPSSGVDGDLTVTTDTTVGGDKNYRRLVVQSGVLRAPSEAVLKADSLRVDAAGVIEFTAAGGVVGTEGGPGGSPGNKNGGGGGGGGGHGAVGAAGGNGTGGTGGGGGGVRDTLTPLALNDRPPASARGASGGQGGAGKDNTLDYGDGSNGAWNGSGTLGAANYQFTTFVVGNGQVVTTANPCWIRARDYIDIQPGGVVQAPAQYVHSTPWTGGVGGNAPGLGGGGGGGGGGHGGNGVAGGASAQAGGGAAGVGFDNLSGAGQNDPPSIVQCGASGGAGGTGQAVSGLDVGDGLHGDVTVANNAHWPDGSDWRFRTLTINPGITVTFAGTVRVRVQGPFWNHGALNGDAGGYAGAPGRSEGDGAQALQGSGPGGGWGGNGKPSNDCGSGGGGGYATAGVNGTGSTGGTNAGRGGSAYGNASTPQPGSGGGGGAAQGGFAIAGGRGGNGGAAIDIACGEYRGAGGIWSRGQQGTPGTTSGPYHGGGGGSGSGGWVRVQSPVQANSGGIDVSGGPGYFNASNYAGDGAGGFGTKVTAGSAATPIGGGAGGPGGGVVKLTAPIVQNNGTVRARGADGAGGGSNGSAGGGGGGAGAGGSTWRQAEGNQGGGAWDGGRGSPGPGGAGAYAGAAGGTAADGRYRNDVLPLSATGGGAPGVGGAVGKLVFGDALIDGVVRCDGGAGQAGATGAGGRGTGGGGGGSGGAPWLAGGSLAGAGALRALGGGGGAPGGYAGPGGAGGQGRIRLDLTLDAFTGSRQGAVTKNAVPPVAVPLLV